MAKRKKKSTQKNTLYIVIFALCVLFGSAIYYWGSSFADDFITPPDIPEGVLEVHFIDVGQADCILIREPGGKDMLIDAGNPEDWKLINNYLGAQGVSEFDKVIFTHPHNDHIGSAAMIVNNYPITQLFMPDVVNTSKSFENLINAIEAQSMRVTRPQPGSVHYLGEAKFTILAPNDTEYKEMNNYSIVIKLEYGETSFMLTGDAEKKSEKEILEMAKYSAISLESTFLKAGHHGSKSSSSKNFVEAVMPQYAHITCAEENSYSHPHDETLETFTANGVKYTRADINGHVIVYTDGMELNVITEK